MHEVQILTLEQDDILGTSYDFEVLEHKLAEQELLAEHDLELELDLDLEVLDLLQVFEPNNNLMIKAMM